MPNYRTVTIDKDGKVKRRRDFVCDTDDDAIVWAKHSVDDAPIELWSGARFVARLEPRSEVGAHVDSRRTPGPAMVNETVRTGQTPLRPAGSADQYGIPRATE
jgi:hypothetical protein